MTIVKDWIHSAAVEISSHIADSNPHDPFKIYEIIEKNAPFKPGIAYMPVPKCRTCKHWSAFDGWADPPFQGMCSEDVAEVPVRTDDNDIMSITSIDFGCIKWKAKS